MESSGVLHAQGDIPTDPQDGVLSSAASAGHTIVKGGHQDLKKGSTLPFRYVGKLGTGMSAVVDEVEDPISGRTFAQKVFRNYSGNSKFFKEAFKNEVDILKRLHSHPHIVQVYWSYTRGRELGMLLTPVASDKDLGSYLLDIQDTGEGPTLEQRDVLLRAFGCLASGLAYIHRHTIRHKDIKPQNILVHNGQMIYTDFGIALDADGQNTTTTGITVSFTRRYCAPEVANNEPRNRKSDVFSLGCVFFEMLALLYPESGLNTQDPRPYWEQAQAYQSPLSQLRKFPDLEPGTNYPRVFPRSYKLSFLCFVMTTEHVVCRIDAASLPHLVWQSQIYPSHVDLELFCESCKGPASVAPKDVDVAGGISIALLRWIWGGVYDIIMRKHPPSSEDQQRLIEAIKRSAAFHRMTREVERHSGLHTAHPPRDEASQVASLVRPLTALPEDPNSTPLTTKTA
jgi:serine/threonine protein kinase